MARIKMASSRLIVPLPGFEKTICGLCFRWEQSQDLLRQERHDTGDNTGPHRRRKLGELPDSGCQKRRHDRRQLSDPFLPRPIFHNTLPVLFCL